MSIVHLDAAAREGATHPLMGRRLLAAARVKATPLEALITEQIEKTAAQVLEALMACREGWVSLVKVTMVVTV